MNSILSGACILKIPNFEGPFDLLFHLIEKNKLDIHDIPISLITEQYIDYLDNMASMDMDIASEFIVMASTLLQIKSRMLLPVEKEEEEEQEDPRENLVSRLLEYRKFKDASIHLKERWEIWSYVSYRLPLVPEKVRTSAEIPMDLDLLVLQDTAQRVFMSYHPSLDNTAPKMAVILKKEKHTVKSKINQIISFLKKKVRLIFNDLFKPDICTKEEKAAGFAAILELSKVGRIKIRQDKPFSDIILTRGPMLDGNKEISIID